MNQLVNRYVGIILICAAFTGLFVPSFGAATPAILLTSLATIIFASFFRVDLSSLAAREGLADVSKFWMLRYILIPAGVYFTLHWFSDFYATCFLLLTLLPAAVSSPAFTAMFGGQVGHTMRILIVSSFMSIGSIPLLTTWLLGKTIEVDSGGMFLTMLYTIVIPFVAHLPLRRWKRFSGSLSANLPLITAFCLSLMFIAATSANKPVIFSHPVRIGQFAIVSLIGYMALYLGGLFLLRRGNKTLSISHSVCSGANNIGLGVALTAVYFPAGINVFFIVAQLAWVVALFPMRRVYSICMKQ